MKDNLFIRKVAVLGAGVMGAQIAAHCVNAGIETCLFDLAAEEGNPNGIVDKAIGHLSKLKPSPLATAHTAFLLKACNYEQHLFELNGCDLIIEAIAERLDWKESVYQRITPHLHEQAIVVSNTSGLSVNALAQALPESQRARFCGVHFFNPPRYMHLAELIPTRDTPPALLDLLESWLTSYLGKGVVRAKDTPNFIANRVGVFSLLITLHHAEKMGLGLDEVDALTGGLIGRPKSATCRTMDVVGLDTLRHVVDTMQQQLEHDPWHAQYRLPTWLLGLIDAGHLGQKSGQGIYRKKGKVIEVYDLDTQSYRAASGNVDETVKRILKNPDSVSRMQQLADSTHPQSQFLTACFRDLFHYCAFHLGEIAHSVRDVDCAMRWGFGWQEGPFETWQAAGVSDMSVRIEQAIEQGVSLSHATLPQWITGLNSFYQQARAFSPVSGQYELPCELPVYQRQLLRAKSTNSQDTWFENEGVKLWHLQDEVGVIEFKSKANTVGQAVLDGLHSALDWVEQRAQGVILHQQDASNFSSGADLRGVAALLQEGKIQALERMVQDFQTVAMRLKYSPVPTIAALRGRAFGGGCELMLHCDGVTAAFESYPGLVEVGVGVIPAGGGLKEMALRAQQFSKANPMALIRSYFEQIATAVVSSSAPDALSRGYLRAHDRWVMHTEEVLYAAFMQVKSMCAANYMPPIASRFAVVGREGCAQLQAGLVNWLEGGFISSHDFLIASKLAFVLCGGDVNQGELVSESWLLKLEREAFIELAQTALTQARIKHLLETGKPLRN